MKKNLKACIEAQSFSEPTCLLDMNDYDRIKADGLTPDLKHNRSAHMTAAWHFSERTAVRMELKADLSAHRFLTFSLFAVNGQGGSVNLRMEAAGKPTGKCGYAQTLPICRNGWNDFRVELPFMETVGEPNGWDQIRAVVLDCAIGGQANSTDTVLYIDNLFVWEDLAPMSYVKMPELKGAALFAKTADCAIIDRRRMPNAIDSDPDARPFEAGGVLWLPMAPIAAVIAHKAVADNKALTLSFTYRRRTYQFYGNSDRYLENGEEQQLPFFTAVRAGTLFFPAGYLCTFFHWRQIFTDPTGIVLLSNRKNAFESGRDNALLAELSAALTFSLPTGNELLGDLHKKITNPDKGRLLLLPEEWMAQRKLAKTDAELKERLDSFKAAFGTASPIYKAELLPEDAEEAATAVTAFAALYRLTGDKKYAARSFEACQKLTEPEDWNTGAHSLQEIDSTVLALALVYDWCHTAWTEGEKAILERSLLRGALRPGVDYYNGRRSIGCPDSARSAQVDCALTAAALALADIYPETAQRILSHSLRHISLALGSYAPDGGYAEGMQAWEKATRSLALTIAMLNSACGKDYGLSMAPGFAATARFAIAAETSNGAWGYNGASSAPVNTSVFAWFTHRYGKQTPLWIRNRDLTQSNRSVDLLDLVWYAPLEKGLTPELPLDALYRRAGLVMLRSSWDHGANLIGLHGGSNHANGIELDAGSFLLEMNGERFFADPEGDLPQALIHRAEGHNTLTLGDVSNRLLDQNPDAEVAITEARSAAELGYAVADMASVSDRILRGKRGILLTHGRQVAVVQDEITFTEPTAAVWRAYTKATVQHASSRTLLLEQNGKALLCKLSGAGNARFEVKELENTPYRCLTVKTEAKEKLRMSVAFRTFREGDARTERIYELVPMSTWEIE